MNYVKEIQDLMLRLKTSINGLSDYEAKLRLAQYGKNLLEEEKPTSPLIAFLAQFKNPLMLLLILASTVSFLVGKSVDAIGIIAAVILSAVLGFVQEFKAEKAIRALKKLVSLKALVIRNGEKRVILADELVVGDIIILDEGDKVPADARLFEANNLTTDESILTGESTPVEKELVVLSSREIFERKNEVFMGTVVTRGRGKAIVTGTGKSTEVGKIAEKLTTIRDEKSPLQKNLDALGKTLGLIGITLSAAFFAIGFFKGFDLLKLFTTSVSLAVAAVPEGLPTIMTITLAIGMQRMAAKNAIVRKMHSVETLGSATVICSDKTGTLTMNEMNVRKVYADSKFFELNNGLVMQNSNEIAVAKDPTLQLLTKIGGLCNNAFITSEEGESPHVAGDQVDSAVFQLALDVFGSHENICRNCKFIHEIPFDSKRKLMSMVYMLDGELVMLTKGAPEILVEKCSKIFEYGRARDITPVDKQRFLDAEAKMAEAALRNIAVAFKNLQGEKEAYDESDESNLVLVGLVGMNDPPRAEAKEAIQVANAAGIKVIMITGDSAGTAKATASELGFTPGKVITGKELEQLSQQDLEKYISEVNVIARASPDHKLRIVAALKAKGHIVAMTGDGVNDALALKQADIGVAMGKNGTEIARETADLVLVDDNFATIISAIEHGRKIYDNIRNFIRFQLSTNIAALITMLSAPLIGLGLPLTTLQILWINLIMDGPPALALGVEPSDRHVMQRKPRNPTEHILSKPVLFDILVSGLIMAVGVVLLFASESNSAKAVTLAFTAMVLFQVFNAFNCRSFSRSGLFYRPFSNSLLLAAILSVILMQYLIVSTPIGNSFFSTVPLEAIDWLKAMGVALIILVYGELRKAFSK